ncbi:AAA-like domain-containing protein, partial [Leptolyngbya sp. PCC 6406]|uniref:AAA-like domain-containing protein n=1 Tax=Leptolyngbya sp. PCC 6406 TaxID=1173264 RepID=UPI00055CE1B8
MAETPNPQFYTTGGTVQAAEGVYIPRQADGELLQRCREREFAYVLTPRQMGKSSLMINTAQVLQQEGVRTAIVDLQDLGTQLTADQWYLGVLVKLEDQLLLETDVVTWWEDHGHLGVSQRLTMFFEQVLLVEVTEPLVVFVDEIDSTLPLDFTDDFFTAVRYLYSARAQVPAFHRLSFVLIGVATPSDLIRDPRRTPFNIGHRIDLQDFTLAEAMPLVAGLGLPPEQGERVMGWVLAWTGGHPYLTQRLCQEMALVGGTAWTEAEVERLVQRVFLGATGEQETNLLFVRDMLTRRAPEPGAVLKTYGQVWRGRPPVADEEQSVVKAHLKLAGVVQRQGRWLQVRNEIYRRVFDRRWIRAHLPESFWQRLRPAMPIIAVLVVAIVGLSGLAAYANQQRLEATYQRQVAEEQRFEAETALAATQVAEQAAATAATTAQEAEQEAVAQQQAAEREAQRAEEAAQAAAAQRQQAEEQRQRAEVQTQLAQQETGRANQERQRAEAQTDLATAQQREAERQAAIAQLERDRAEGLRQEAERQTAIAEVREKAARALYFLTTLRQVDGLVLTVDALGASREKGLSEVLPAVHNALLTGVQTVRERNLLRSHQGVVRSVALSGDGQTIVSGGDDGTVRLWSRSGEALGTPFTGHQGVVRSVALSGDGQTIVSGGDDGTVRLWSRSGEALGTPFTGHQGWVWSVALSGDDQTIVSGGSDGTVRLWSRSGEALGTPFTGHEGRVSSVALSGDGQTIVSGGLDGTVRLWSRSGEALGTPFTGHQGGV